jgi:hypothetical protein
LEKSLGAFFADPDRSLGRLAPVSHDENNSAKKFAGVLAKFLSAGQKETGMTGMFERRQIINAPQKPL